jgi:thiol-disulfide isomerase/thioredoxin
VKASFRPALAALALLVAAMAAPTTLNAAPDDKVVAIDGPTLKKTVQDQKGKVVVLNVWATWCDPCIEEFPDFVKFHNAYKDKGVVVISASADDPADKAEVEAFVRKNGAEFPVYMRKAGRVEKFIEPIMKNWAGSVPMTLVYGKDGKLSGKPQIGLRTLSQLSRMIDPLLKK